MDSGGIKIFRDILFCILAGWTAIWAQEKSPGDSLQSCIEIHAPEPGLNVWVNGEWIGKTPVPLIRVPAAACRVRVQHPDSANWMSRDWIKHVHLKPGECRKLLVELDNSFWIGSDPGGVSVYSDTGMVGKTPLVFYVPQGETARVILRQEGYLSVSVLLGPGKPEQVFAAMEPNSLSRGVHRRGGWIKKYGVWSTGALALVSGGLGYFLKWKADRAFDRYSETGNLTMMNTHYDDTVRYDKLSSLFYWVGEAFFLFFVGLFIKGYGSE